MVFNPITVCKNTAKIIEEKTFSVVEDRDYRAKFLLTPGYYNVKIWIPIRKPFREHIESSVVPLEIKNPVGLESEAYDIWKTTGSPSGPVPDEVNNLKKIVQLYPKTEYAKYAQFRLAIKYYTLAFNNKDKNYLEMGLPYIEPLIYYDYSYSFLSDALDLAIFYFHRLKINDEEIKMCEEKLITFPNTEATRRILMKRDPYKFLNENTDKSTED